MVEGVSEVTVVGASQRAIRIVLKPEKLAEYGIAYQTVRSKLLICFCHLLSPQRLFLTSIA